MSTIDQEVDTMFKRRLTALMVVVAIGWLALAAGATGAARAEQPADSTEPVGQVAVFEGSTIDLARGWGDAHACAIWEDRVAECFRTEAELEAWLAGLMSPAQETSEKSVTTAATACSSALRLYDGVGYSGDVLYLWSRGSWIDLWDVGFANRTSSYKIGACSSYFADYPGGGGDWYPTSLTSAYLWSSSMLSGWDNRVSSVYLR
ncbi:MAG TPA: hypothetical protein ENH33_10215 [Actinobacteria bacterium]|nr:hypothetical protein [Actinomycetota bacterium]